MINDDWTLPSMLLKLKHFKVGENNFSRSSLVQYRNHSTSERPEHRKRSFNVQSHVH